MLAFGGLLLSKSQTETLRLLQTHELVGRDAERMRISRRRYRVGDGVLGPKVKPAPKVTEFLDSLHLDLGELHIRPLASREWPAQGTSRIRNGHSVLFRHLSWLLHEGAFRDGLGANVRLFVRVGNDFGHFSRWSISGAPLMLGLIAVLPDPEVFIAGAAAAVSMPLPWLLAAENDTLDVVQHYSQFLPPLLQSLLEPIVLRDENAELEFTVSVEVCLRCRLRALTRVCSSVAD